MLPDLRSYIYDLSPIQVNQGGLLIHLGVNECGPAMNCRDQDNQIPQRRPDHTSDGAAAPPVKGWVHPPRKGYPPKKRKKEERRKRAGKKEERKKEHRKRGVLLLRIGG